MFVNPIKERAMKTTLFLLAVVMSFGFMDCGTEDLCKSCLLPSDCETDVCTCVYDKSEKSSHCWACVPPEWDPITGSETKTYQCESIH